eukprot:CAMPEP_0117080564 /NCGR_PEP_ID=MMETSP0472-20121206/56836_1 /TAXON_ID=693140 ORGANISM="Tiarina fusus, Strain LIS" /NCGR_SAMPLE_ID=MMETSP0472 /ASSEMBLY_ACC=CAM_ASM_000603 /LENGTH=611 /DNA_ID=CAMNT_0004808243 /DNA_START=180 /DNA_END=2015 /DNA_ORIENTATION=+
MKKVAISNTGEDKATILSISGGKGCGKTRALKEIAIFYAAAGDTLPILATYNSFSNVPFKSKIKNSEDIVEQDFAARVGYAFYRQYYGSLCWKDFQKEFDSFNFGAVMGTISSVFPNKRILLLVDELLTVCYWFPNTGSLSFDPFSKCNQQQVSLQQVLHLLASHQDVNSTSFDYVVSSLDEHAFEGFIASSGRYLHPLPIPIFQRKHVELIYSLAMFGGSSDPPQPAEVADKSRMDLLVQFTGYLPWHVTKVANLLHKLSECDERVDLWFKTNNMFPGTSNSTSILSWLLKQVELHDINLPPDSGQEICLNVIWMIFSEALNTPYALKSFLYTPEIFGEKKKLCTFQRLSSWGLLVHRGGTLPEQVYPSMMILIPLARKYFGKNPLTTYLEQMCCLDIRSTDGLNNEKFHTYFFLSKLILLNLFNVHQIPLSFLYNCCQDDYAKPENKPDNQQQNQIFLTWEELNSIQVNTTNAARISPEFTIEQLHRFLFQKTLPRERMILCPGQQGFERVFPLQNYIVLFQDKVSGRKVATTWSNADIMTCCAQCDDAIELESQNILVIWAALRKERVEVRKQNSPHNFKNNFKVLKLTESGLLKFYRFGYKSLEVNK